MDDGCRGGAARAAAAAAPRLDGQPARHALLPLALALASDTALATAAGACSGEIACDDEALSRRGEGSVMRS